MAPKELVSLDAHLDQIQALCGAVALSACSTLTNCLPTKEAAEAT